MNISQLVQAVNTLADEEIATTAIVGFANDAVARINVKSKAEFPFFSANAIDSEYEGFPETWQRALLIPFIVGRIKQTDSSQFEYSDAYGEFMDNLITFQAQYTIPEQYKSVLIKNSFTPDYTGNYWGW